MKITDNTISCIMFENEGDYDEQHEYVQGMEDVCCLVCNNKEDELLIGYLEPEKGSGFANHEYIRIWYYVCGGCFFDTLANKIKEKAMDIFLNSDN